MDNFWPVDNLWIVNSAQSYPQLINSGRNATKESYPHVVHRVINIEYCVALEQQNPVDKTGFWLAVPGLNSMIMPPDPRLKPLYILD